MKKSIAVLFAAGIIMPSCPVKNTSSEIQTKEVIPVPTMTVAAENISEAKPVIPPAQFATPSPLPTSKTTTVPEMKDSAAEAPL